ncbi:MAG: MFS transporter [Hyphomicrobiales bacterium]|nr:MFS transporter [Hyphomicrobiales bacterium]
MVKMGHILASRRFLPLFLVQFLGALNDNVFKNALIILITYVAATRAAMNAQLLVTVAAGIFILPFFLFSATAGQMADKYEKSTIIKHVKVVEILLMGVAVWGFYTESIFLLMTVLFLMGAQSAFFGPLKYSILPDHLAENELMGGNALIEAGTFLAILLGTIAGGLLILAGNGVFWVSVLVISCALTGWLVSFWIPKAGPAAPEVRLEWNIFQETWKIMGYVRQREDVFLAIIGISWFWLVGAVFLAQFPVYAKDILQADETVVTLFLTVFSLGIGAGSLICNYIVKDKIDGRFVPFGAIGMALFTVCLYLASYQPTLQEGALLDVWMFLQIPRHWLILASLLGIAVAGGIYIVPLYAIMQARTESSIRARVIAGNNILNALFMVFSALATLGMLALSLNVIEVFLVVALVNLPVAWMVRKIVRTQSKKRELSNE